MKTVKLMFETDAGKSFAVSMNYAAPALFEEGGDALVRAALDAIMTQQPFNVTLASKKGAELIDRTVTEVAATAA
ncbi:MAG: DUF2922 domain-containing protein [Synergistaceae bacterium]|nr:DUF2922 domain-containing protein [Synergistaceae bacterium]